MKKTVAYLLLLAMCLGTVACGSGDVGSITESSSVAVGEKTESSSLSGGDETESTLVSIEDETESSSSESSDNTESSKITDSTDSSEATQEKEESSTTQVAGGDASSESSEVKVTEATEIETEDYRLSQEYAPVKYFGAKGLYDFIKDGIYDEMPQLFYGYDEVSYLKDENGKAYTRVLCYNDYQTSKEAYFSLCTSPMGVAPMLAVKYRTTTPGINMEIYTDSVNYSPTSSSNIAISVVANGEWQIAYVNLGRISAFNGSSVNYFRFDFMNSSTSLPVDAYVDFEYIGFFNSDEDAEMFETGKYVPVVYVDPDSGYKQSTNIVYASSIDMINGAGGFGAATFSYRGGNSLSGIDKFNHNGTTLSGGILAFSGWTVVEGGVEKYVWSIDGKTWFDATPYLMDALGKVGDAHIQATEKYTGGTIIDKSTSVINGGYQGNTGTNNIEKRARGMACDLLLAANEGDIVNVRFAAVPKSAPDELCLIAYVKGVEVVSDTGYVEETEAPPEILEPSVEPEDCTAHEASREWHPVIGELKEQKLCVLCGSVMEERDLVYYLSLDAIEDMSGIVYNGAGGSGGYGWYGKNKVIGKIDASKIAMDGTLSFGARGWIALNCGIGSIVYRIVDQDGNVSEWITTNQGPTRANSDIAAAVDRENLGIVRCKDAIVFNVKILLKEYENQKVTVELAVIPTNNPDVVVPIVAMSNIKVPEAPTEVVYYNAIDALELGANKVNNPVGQQPGGLFVYNAEGVDISATTSIKWSGWSATDGGYKKWVYSVDGGVTWHDINGGYVNITRPDVIGAVEGKGFVDFAMNGSLGLVVDLSQYIGQTVDVIFGAVTNYEPDFVCQMVKVTNVSVTGACKHADINWTPIAGELQESAVCSVCGETIVRDIVFMNNIDIVEGSVDGEAVSINPPDGVTFVSKPTQVIGTRGGKDIVVQGWLAVNGGVQKYVYSVDGGNTWLDCGNQPNYNDAKFEGSTAHENAINGANLGFTAADADVNGRYRVTCNLSGMAGKTVEVIFGAILEENTTAQPLQLMIITVRVPADGPEEPEESEVTTPEESETSESETIAAPGEIETSESETATTPEEPEVEEIPFVKAIDNIYIGETRIANPAGGYGGNLFVLDASSYEMSGTQTVVSWYGWAGVNGGFSGWVYSLDGGNTWVNTIGDIWNLSDGAILNAIASAGFTNATEKGGFRLRADLSAYIGRSVDIIFGAIPNSDTARVIPMVKIENVKVKGECSHTASDWTPVAGEARESSTCTICGDTVTRDVTFVVCSDKIYYDGGTRGWAATAVQSTPYVVDNVASMPIISGKGLTIQGWVAMNGGISSYKWSIDGVTWYDAGAGYFSNGGITGVVDGKNIGIANYTAGCQYNINLTGLCDLDVGTYTVYVGAIPANNDGAVVIFMEIQNVVVK